MTAYQKQHKTDMDKIEKIRQEIERLKGVVTTTIKELRMPEPSERMCGELDAYDDILWFLDTLEEEPDKDLEEAAEEYIKKGRYLPEAFIVRPVFIDGAKWQAERILEHVKLAYGKVSMNPFDCSEAFEELISKIESI